MKPTYEELEAKVLELAVHTLTHTHSAQQPCLSVARLTNCRRSPANFARRPPNDSTEQTGRTGAT
jgi:hypothetical protein